MKSALPFFICFVAVCFNASASDKTNWKRLDKEGREALEMNQYSKAEQSYLQAAEAGEKLGPDNEHYSESLRGLGFAALQMRDYPNADFAYTRLVRADGIRLGTNSPVVAEDLLNLTQMAGYSAQYLRGQESVDAATAIVSNRFGDHSPAMGICLATRGDLEMQQQHNAAAETNFRQALEIFKTRGIRTYFTGLQMKQIFFGVPETYDAGVLNDLALCQIQEQKFNAAEGSARSAVQMLERAYGMNSVHLVTPLDNLANACANQKKYTEAEHAARRALSLTKKVDPAHPMVRTTRNLLVMILTAEGKENQIPSPILP